MVAPFLSSWLRRPAPRAWCRTALARGASLQAAVDAACSELRGCGPADLALVFVSTSFASDLPRLLPLLQQRLQARHWLGCAGGGVVGTEATGTPRELEDEPALSVTLLALPGADLHTFAIAATDLPDLDGPADPWLELVGCSPTAAHSMLLLVDPGCGQINDLISGLDYAYPGVVKVGGIAGQHSARHGSLLLGDGVCGGAIGCLIGGSWQLDAVLAQGCRPIGPVFEIDQVQRNVMLQLSSSEQSGTPVACLQGILQTLSPAEREQVRHSLFLGVGRDSFSSLGSGNSLGTGNSREDRGPAFLVRNLVGVDPRNGAVAVAERLRVGQQVQFQLRDAEASSQEARMLLAAERRRQQAPLAALLFACLGRGRGLFGHPDGDVSICRELFATTPVAGAFCNGEIGPVGGATHLHGYTASWCFLVPAEPSAPES